ncbi:c-type cytochrome [Membranicola marinus]|uniref:C-type cytochrome n=1 Tax=Membranihabitans marinus TaxID=1227546 RepID=A0A953LA19_9BACT|nr:PVC-type heme-binding CxxCH protein [Membranihabitans marinus]MBY5957191.1 c-type cytochrome [Membranihabitans marinus]
MFNFKYHPFISIIFFSCILLFGCETGKEAFPDAEEILSTFKVAEGFQIELMAVEPLISDPVAMEIDEQGRMYVVEMHGYPLDKSGSGNVKLLTDTNGDGIMNHSETFASDLLFPTGVLRWKKGILVTDPPNVLYLEDTDGDGIADIRDTILSGFAVSNPQHNFNTPILGIDNWIYISNEPAVTAKVYTEEFNDLGSEVRFYGKPNGPVLSQNARGQRIRMKPDELKVEMTSSRGQFGQTYDQWGRQFLVSNSNHTFQEVMQASYLNRNPNLLISHATESISDHGNAAEVYPITLNPEYQLLTDLGVFTSACGSVAYSDGLFPSEYENTIFVAEPVSNLVHVDKITETGAAFTASRMFEKKEFLTSEDAWSRPVNHYVGPDGALYVVDYYRRIIEHPEWMGEDVIQSGTIYDGVDQGRIFRITPKGTPAAQWTTNLDMVALSDQELVELLGHENAWYRRNAQRLLLDRENPEAIPLLKEMVRSGSSALGRLHAAWTLEGMNALSSDLVVQLLHDPIPGVRENAVKLSETFLKDGEIQRALLALHSDENARVRFQLMCTLGSLDTPEANQARDAMVVQNVSDSWFQVAALSAHNPRLANLLETSIGNFNENKRSYQEFIKRIVSMISAQNDVSSIKTLILRSLGWKDQSNAELPAAILEGLVQGRRSIDYKSAAFEAERNALLSTVFTNPFQSVRQASLSLLSHMGLPKGRSTQKAKDRSLSIIKDLKAKEDDRVFAIQLLALSGDDQSYDVLKNMLVPNESIRIQRVALQAMHRLKGQEFVSYLIDHWPSLAPGLRDEAVRMLLSGEPSIRMMVEALEKGVIDPSAIPWRQQVGMMAQANDELRKRSRDIFSQKVTDADKKELLDKYQEATEPKGDPVKGLAVYKAQCALCHQIGGENGTAYGPDLATIQNRKRASILKDILDPGLSIADGYDLWEVTLKNGETKQGIIGSETSTSINLRILGSEDEVISREDIERIQAKNISVMPAGLENMIGVEDMMNLLAFIKKIK